MAFASEFRYRPEVDGLRAVAILIVVLYHGKLGLPGGFVGVDVFFVVSGYLITSLIARDLENGSFSYLSFWERRARRILPAAVFLVLSVLVIGSLILLPRNLEELGRSAAYQAIFAANVFFRSATGYFAGAADQKPLLHTWSLAVEEQFYLIFPWLLVAAHRASLRRPLLPVAATGAGILASLAVSQAAVTFAPGSAFYLLPSRAWELFIGVAVALAPPIEGRWSRILREAVSVAGLAAIVVSSAIYSHETPFPGFAAIPPCAGTAAILIATRGSGGESVSITRLLALRPVVFIGLISYSLYLIHWPILAFLNYWSLDDPSLTLRVAAILTSVVTAAASWRWIETPFRDRTRFPSQRAVLALAGCSLIIVGGAGLAVATTAPRLSLFPPTLRHLAEARPRAMAETSGVKSTTLEDARAGRLSRIGIEGPPRVLLWGDSHARSLLPAITALAAQCGTTVAVAWQPSMAPLVGFHPQHAAARGRDFESLNQAILEVVRKQQIADVLLVARWSGYSPRPEVAAALRDTVSTIELLDARAWVLEEVPNHPVEVPKALIHSRLFGTDLRPYRASISAHAANGAWLREALTGLRRAGHLLSVDPYLLEPGVDGFRMEAEGEPLYYDWHHLSPAGARLVAPALLPVFRNCPSATR